MAPFICLFSALPIRSDQQTGHYVDPREAQSSARLPEHPRTPAGLPLNNSTDNTTLEYSRTSGFSPSDYELSQYMNGADLSDPASQTFPPPPPLPPSGPDPGEHTEHHLENTVVTHSHKASVYFFGVFKRFYFPLSSAEPVPVAPLKYAIPHAVVSFGTAGQLLRVCPGLSTKENQLEIHSLEV